MFTVHFLEISIAFVLKLYSLNVIKKIENRIESLRIESGHLNRYPALMWGILKRKVEKHHVSNIQQLSDVIMEEWKRMPATTCAALVNSMPRRIKAVLDNNGAPTKY